MLQGLSTQELCSIAPPSVSYGRDGDLVRPTNVITLGSYNWVDSQTPTIIVPGSPSIWRDPVLPLQLAPDSGPTFIDQNAHRASKSALEPAFRAISVAQGKPNGELSLAQEELDIVTDRNNLRKLLRFVCANGPNRVPNRGRNNSFRVDAQLAPNNKTLVFTRFDENTIDRSTGFKGYGHSFEEAVTTVSAPIITVNANSTRPSSLVRTGYHRIIRYDLLGLRFMVRFEVDAMTGQSLDTLTELLGATSISRPIEQGSPASNEPVTTVELQGTNLRHVLHGAMVPHESLIELKTLKMKSSLGWYVCGYQRDSQ
ncbi:hypothetical protein RhiJN_28440 [Ceratobasidium sp. AG-Ba]|nr:hypothetical protein RhiJN_28440 [Ceratobasidium sp. AG-Ba]